MKNQPAVIRLALLGLPLILAAPAAAETLVLDDLEQYEFAGTLMGRGEFFKAVLEYERLLHFFPGSPLADEATFGIGLAYDGAGEHAAAGDVYRGFLLEYPDSELLPEIRLALGRSLALRYRYQDARRELEALAGEEPPTTASGRAAILHGLTYLPVDDFAAAGESFSWAAERFTDEPAGELAEVLADLAGRRDEVDTLSPIFNGFLSALVPGLGQIIAGRTADGFIALFTNALWIGGTVWAVSEDEIPTAVVTGLFGLSFYVGNVYNAGEAAAELNRRRIAALTAEIVAEVRAWERENGTGVTLAPEVVEP